DGESTAGQTSPAIADDMMLPGSEGPSGGETGDLSGGELTEEIQAAQEALEQAGIALQTAGVTLETATTDEELAAAEAQLARARLAVIVAGQDLADLGAVMDHGVPGDVLADAEASLNEANAAIVIATESIFSSRVELPDFNPGAAGQGDSELDQELNESIAIFEGRILDARNEVIGSSPAPTSAENIPGVAILGGSTDEDMEPGTMGEENADEFPGLIEETQQGRMPEGAEVAVSQPPPASIPDDIPSPQGDDIVAQQLREAAIAESDPALREKLWEEYKRYKAGL
ncbi:MAG: hypothetical protein O3B72_09070, partial [Proteobacteria bacterium]|nr:hypothetical protein [Pseudomonadota bacterium]